MTGYPFQEEVDVASNQAFAFWISGYWLVVMMEQMRYWPFQMYMRN